MKLGIRTGLRPEQTPLIFGAEPAVSSFFLRDRLCFNNFINFTWKESTDHTQNNHM